LNGITSLQGAVVVYYFLNRTIKNNIGTEEGLIINVLAACLDSMVFLPDAFDSGLLGCSSMRTAEPILFRSGQVCLYDLINKTRFFS
jgi:hypothetical protein